VAEKVQGKKNELNRTKYAESTKRKNFRFYKRASFKARNCPDVRTVSRQSVAAKSANPATCLGKK
jgi:hypothetical protein